jgi:isoaspartyl peptidase/L-asparaginase-like protein (Ntn-hydrolase superfamily)
MIAVSPKGDVAWSFNTAGMYRACAKEGDSEPVVALW